MEEKNDEFYDIKVNEYQTDITKELLEQYPKEVQEQFKEFVLTVPFIKNLISPNRQRAKDRPRDEKGRIIVDLANPHILENMDYFRQAAIKFEKDGRYTDLKPNSNPNSPYGKWIRQEIKRCWEGMVRPSDGEWVTGYMYFYLNYVPMMVTKEDKNSKKKRASRTEGFPAVWEATYWRFHYIDQARNGGLYNDFAGGNHAVELSKRGSGKAHPYDADVITPTGIRKWGDLQIGDYVFGDDGSPTKIIDIPFDKTAPIYKITLKDGRTVEASEGHLWKVYVHNRKGLQILTTKELLDIYKAERKISYRNPSGVEFRCGVIRNEGIELPNKDIPIDPYTLGLLLGDGCFRTLRTNNSLYYTCQDTDAKYIIPNIPYKVTKRKYKYAYSIWIDKGAHILDSLGLWMHKSEDKFIPKEYLFNSKDVRRNLLKGLIDSDGYVSNSSHPHNGYEISVSSKQFAEDIMWLCRSLGYNADMHIKHPWYYNKQKEKVQGLTSYRVSIHTEDTLSYLPRKKNICSTSAYSKSRNLYTRIVDIEYVGEKQAKCITVDNKSHCYLIEDFITTHNSFSLATIMAHNLILGENAEAHKRTTTILTAYLREYLAEKDGTFSKFIPIKSFLAEHTQFPRRMLIDAPNKMSWKSGYKDKATGAEKGDQNILLGLSSKDDVAKIRGKRGYILFEEFGSFPNLLEIYNNVKDGMREGKYVYGLAYLLGTAGDSDSDFHGAQELVYNPKGYDVYALPNVWDKPNQGRPWFAFFTPAFVNLKGFYNKDGVSDIVGGMLFKLMDRYRAKYETGDPRTILKEVSNMPFTPSEAIIQGGVSQFPVVDIENRLLEINADPHFYDSTLVGQLVLNDNKVEFMPTSDEPIRYYQKKDNKNMPGAIEIYEQPQKDSNGKVYENRYIAGADPYDNDESTTTSLGSILILDLMTDRIVAEYTGRPAMADDYFEICRRLCLYYNARLNYESNKKGLYAHFSKMNSTYLLTDVLEILVDKQMCKPGGVGNTAKGTNASQGVNGWARQLINKYLLTPQTIIVAENGEEKEIKKHNLEFIKNKALLIELSQWNSVGNFDRVSAMGMLMLLREDKLRLMGGRYNSTEEDIFDPDDIANDEYWSNNFISSEETYAFDT